MVRSGLLALAEAAAQVVKRQPRRQAIELTDAAAERVRALLESRHKVRTSPSSWYVTVPLVLLALLTFALDLASPRRSSCGWGCASAGAAASATRSTTQVSRGRPGVSWRCGGHARHYLPRPASRAASGAPHADEKGKLDEVVESKGVRILIEPTAVMHVVGTRMDFVEDALRCELAGAAQGGAQPGAAAPFITMRSTAVPGCSPRIAQTVCHTACALRRAEFTFENPNSKGSCGCGESFTT